MSRLLDRTPRGPRCKGGMTTQGNGSVPSAWWWDEAVLFTSLHDDSVIDPRDEQHQERTDRDT